MVKPGTVLKVFITRTTPPKIKYLIVLAQDHLKVSYACIMINSEINIGFLDTPELQALQYPLLKDKNPFLDHNSFANCANVFLKDSQEIDRFAHDPDISKTEIDAGDIQAILDIVKNAETTRPNYLKNFDF